MDTIRQFRSDLIGIQIDRLCSALSVIWESVMRNAKNIQNEFAHSKSIINSGELMRKFTDPLELSKLNATDMFNVFAAITVSLLLMSVGECFGRIFSSFISLFITCASMSIVAYFMVPLYVINVYIKQTSAGNEICAISHLRKLLICAITEGVIIGCIFPNRTIIEYTPSPALTSLVIGISPTVSQNFDAGTPHILLGATIGIALLVNLLVGLVLGISALYIILTLLYGQIGYLTMQMYLWTNEKPKLSYICNAVFLFAVVACRTVMFLLFGSNAK